jgi:hypothetical protein
LLEEAFLRRRCSSEGGFMLLDAFGVSSGEMAVPGTLRGKPADLDTQANALIAWELQRAGDDH